MTPPEHATLQRLIACSLERYLIANRASLAAFGTPREPSEPVRMLQHVFGLVPDGIAGPQVYAAARRVGVQLIGRPGRPC